MHKIKAETNKILVWKIYILKKSVTINTFNLRIMIVS